MKLVEVKRNRWVIYQNGKVVIQTSDKKVADRIMKNEQFEKIDKNGNGTIEKSEFDELEYNRLQEEYKDQNQKRDNQLRMCWVVLLIMCASTVAVIVQPERMAQADAVLMMMYGSLSAIVGAFFGFNALGGKK